MIVVALSIFTALSFIAWTLINNKTVRTIIGGLVSIVMIGLVGVIIAHVSMNFGLKEVTKTETQYIYSVAGNQAPAGITIKQPIGDKSELDAYIYATNTQGKQGIDKPDMNKITKVKFDDVDQATITTQTVYRKFENDTMKMLFGTFGRNNEKVKTKVIITLPKDRWSVINKEDLMKVQAALQDPQNLSDDIKGKLMSIKDLQDQGRKDQAAQEGAELINSIIKK